ncbi:MAG: M20/M25/M40 family metallo-hydrolase [Acidobacteria bacterium]|nr:M20/M25/M40 family metallo-hydrolase [Acidobacteriota bacterium]
MRFVGLLLAAGLACAQNGMRTRTAAGLDSIDPARLKAELTFLSSDALAGRRSLETGSEVAIQWIASQFAIAGLTPAAGDSYLQPVPLIEFTADRMASSLVIEHAGKATAYHAPDAVSNFPNEVAVSGPIVFAGYGITAPELGYDDYAGIDVTGKVVLLFNHEPREDDETSIFNGRGNTRYANNTYKAFNAQRHGAVAVLAMPDPGHQRGRGRGSRGAFALTRPRIPSEALAEGGPAIPLFTISTGIGAALFDAAGKQPAAVQSAINAGPAPASFAIPDTRAELRPVISDRRRADSYNVAALIEGSDPALRNETIVFSAHFDHDGTGPLGVLHGADDNGSGTVGVVELARAFARNPVKPRRSLLFIVFAAEERGLLGSYYYVSHPLRPLASTRAVINFDMIGRNEAADPRVQTAISPDTSNELALIGTHYSPDYRAVVERNNQSIGLKLNYKWDRDSANSVLFRSDQYPFLLHDIPAVWWFTGFHPDYHQVTDTVDRINFSKMARILRLAYLSGFEFADDEHPPLLNPKAMAR